MRKLATLLMMVFALSAKAQQTPSYQHTIDLGIGLWIPGHTDPGVIDNRWYDEKRHNGPITSVTYQYMMNRQNERDCAGIDVHHPLLLAHQELGAGIFKCECRIWL